MASQRILERDEEIQRRRERGEGVTEIAHALGISTGSVYTALHRLQASEPDPERASQWYTCENCGRAFPVPYGVKAMPMPCPRCGQPGYPPMSDHEVRQRIDAMDARLRREEKADERER
jgi:rubrerythrin